MDGLLDKLSSYQIFSSIVPGAVVLLALTWLRGDDMRAMGSTPAFLLFAYVVGLLMNRTAALLTAPLTGECQIRALFAMYVRAGEAAEQKRAIYDTFVMYRTFVVAALVLIVAIAIPAINRRPRRAVLGAAAATALVIFVGATALQGGYLERLTRKDREACEASERAKACAGAIVRSEVSG